jgi:hypothetical protein
MTSPDDRYSEFRASAAECLLLATSVTDQRTRAALLAMAQRWLDLAEEPLGARRMDMALRGFNDAQMRKR